MVMYTIKNHLSYSIRVGHSSDFGLPSVAILPWLCRKRRKVIFTHSHNQWPCNIVGVMTAQRIMLWACITPALGTQENPTPTVFILIFDCAKLIIHKACRVQYCGRIFICRTSGISFRLTPALFTAAVLLYTYAAQPRCQIPTRWREMASFVPNKFWWNSDIRFEVGGQLSGAEAGLYNRGRLGSKGGGVWIATLTRLLKKYTNFANKCANQSSVCVCVGRWGGGVREYCFTLILRNHGNIATEERPRGMGASPQTPTRSENFTFRSLHVGEEQQQDLFWTSFDETLRSHLEEG